MRLYCVRRIFPAPENLGRIALLQMPCIDRQDLVVSALDAADGVAG
jgi:hypothetical protein